MGSGSYSVTNSVARNAGITSTTASLGVAVANAMAFTARKINNAMNPHGIIVRESRDSAEHPNSFPIILGLDVTGSMGSVPNFLVTTGLPKIMDRLFQGGEKDPQILFVAVGDHECDSSPLQVGQFESGDELLDKWLKDVFLEGGGGGNAGESYQLAWYFAGYHTTTDSFEKRGRKGLLFTIGDEPVLQNLPAANVKAIMGDGQYENFSVGKLLKKARETYDVYHVHVMATMAGSRQETVNGWKRLMGENLLIANSPEDIAGIIADTVLKHKTSATSTSVAESTGDEEVL
jgi:hypothetical protein